MYVCAQCLNRFRMYDEDEERHTETCPHCGSEYFDHYSEDEDEDEDEDGDGYRYRYGYRYGYGQ